MPSVHLDISHLAWLDDATGVATSDFKSGMARYLYGMKVYVLIHARVSLKIHIANEEKMCNEVIEQVIEVIWRPVVSIDPMPYVPSNS